LLALAAAVLSVLMLKEWLSLSFFPNPVYAKQDIPLQTRFASGLLYPIKTFLYAPAAALGAFLCFGALVRRVVSSPYDLKQTFICTLIASLGSFPIFAGGDWMENGRFYVAPIALALLFGLPAVVGDLKRPSYVFYLFGGLLFTNIANCFAMSAASWGGISVPFANPKIVSSYRPAMVEWYNRIHTRDASFVDAMIAALDRTDARKLSLGSIQAGLVPYYLIQTTPYFSKFVDFAGLSSTELRGGGIKDFYEDLRTHPEKFRRIGFRLPDFVFDLDYGWWPRLSLMVSLGCRELVRQPLRLHDAPWKRDLETFQFLVDCRGVRF
jgi:hypothetical protein